MSQEGARLVHLDDEALRYAREQLSVAGYDFDGPLARRLVDLALGSPFSFLPLDATAEVRDFRRGGIDDGRSDECLSVAISRWLARQHTGSFRFLLLEDPLARRSDPVARGETIFFQERVYFAGHAGDTPTEVAQVLGRAAAYPGVGVLSEIPYELDGGSDLTEDTLDALASSASAVLVRAWDDEAFVVAPVGERLSPHDFQR